MIYDYNIKILSKWLYERCINDTYNWIYIVTCYNSIKLLVNKYSCDETILHSRILNKIQITPQILSLIKNEDFTFLDIAIKQTLNELRKKEFENDFM